MAKTALLILFISLSYSSVIVGNHVPRIMYWYSKVNQHIDASTGWTWQTDPDGVSGAEIDKLTYCKKLYPATTSVRPYGTETSTTWRERGNVGGPYTNTMPSFECVQPSVPRIMYWQSKVNQHIDASTGWTWQTDPDGVSGAEIDKLTYCKKLYPATTSVRPYGTETSTTWRERGNVGGPYTNTMPSFECVQPSVPRIMYWWGLVNQHIDASTGWTWQTDPDGVSGANLEKLTYCKKFYPATVSVRDFRNETSSTWRAGGNVGGPYTATMPSFECVQPSVPRIMYWWGLVNQHIDASTGWTWQTDPDGVSGANLEKLTYCKKFYPASFSVRDFGNETSSTWRARGNVGGPYTATMPSYECVQSLAPRIMYWWGKVNQHIDANTNWTWQTDHNGVSGANRQAYLLQDVVSSHHFGSSLRHRGKYDLARTG